jgi:Metal binding domain of Ada
VNVQTPKARPGKLYTLLGPDREPYQSQTPGRYGGYRPRKLYGRLDCPSALRAIARGGYVQYRVFFADEASAIAAGYRPCAVCLPAQHAAWKRGREGRMSATPQHGHTAHHTHGYRLGDR